ncbi:MAG: TonB-dependent receptor [Acidobacteria bacterium]|nr:TonB-dependent receptor [Acidobacteriota bacterium]
MTVRLTVCLLVSLLGFAPLQLLSQDSDAIRGVVLDPNRDALPRVTVRLLDSGGAEVARARTDVQGRFAFTGLQRVGYTVVAELLGFKPHRVAAQTGDHLELVLRLAPVREQVVVTATRTEAPTPQLGASTSVLHQKEIEDRLAWPASDLLRALPGATVARTGGLGTQTALFVRGGESDHNKVLLDGIVLNEPGGFFDFTNLTAENLERIEVVRGPQSALFGSDAMTSVVQLFTRRGRAETPRPQFQLGFEAGNNDTWRGRGGLAGELGRFDYSLQWARLSTDNREPNNTFHNTTLSANLGAALAENTWIRLIARGELGRVGTPGQTAFGRPDSDAFLRRRDADAGFALTNQTASFWQQRLTYSFAKSRQVSRNLFADPPFVPEFEGRRAPFPFFDFPFDFLNDNRRHRLSYQSDWQLGQAGRSTGQHFLTFAFDWDREQGAFGDRLFGQVPAEAERDNFGWVAQHQVLWSRLFLTNGVRVEDNESFGTSVVPRSSVAYLARLGGSYLGSTKLKFNFGLGIKEPTLIESFSPSPFFRGNPNLAPERVRSFDVGIEQRFWQERGKLEVNAFDNRFRDLIAFQTVSFFPSFEGSFFNVTRVKAKGAEVALELAPGWGLRGLGTYTFVDSQVVRIDCTPLEEVVSLCGARRSDPATGVGRPLLRRPRHSGSLLIFWDWGRLSVISTTVFVGRRTDSDFSALVPPVTSSQGYTRWDLAWTYRASYRVSYFGVVENLLNHDYMEVVGFPALKLTFRAGARVEF